MARSPGPPLRGERMDERKGKAGRTSAYTSKIEPNLEAIRALVNQGVSEVKIAKRLGVGYTTWKRHKAENPAFRAVLEGSREEVVDELEAAMLKSALGFTKKVKKYYKLKHVEYDNGKRLSEHEELREVEEEIYFPPSFNAGRFLLLNWGGYKSEPAADEQRKREFEHKKAMDEKNNW